MKQRYVLFFLVLVFVFGLQEATAQTFFTARFTAAQENAGLESDASGTAALALTDEGLRFFVTVDGLTGPITNAHFHRAPAGVNAGVVRGIFDDFTGNTASGIWTASDAEPLTDELIDDLLAGNLYLNIHTAANGPGEIRGQVYPTAGTGLSATLTAAQAGVVSDAAGTASVQLTDAGVLYFVTVEGLSGDITNAHFHRAPAGVSAGVVHGIFDTFEGNTAFGLWAASDDAPPTDENIADLLLGNLYLNIHTAANGPGEIRGQVLLTSGWGFSVPLDPGQVVGGVTSDGSGTAELTLTDAGLVYQVTVTGLTGDITNAHFHRAAAGVNGGVVHGIFDRLIGNTASGVWRTSGDAPLTDELIQELIAGNLYLNIHTAANGGGEIRGQVLSDAGTTLSARLTPEQGGNGGVSDGSGTATLTLTDEGLAFQVTIDGLSGPIANAHFHRAPAGVSAGVVRGILDDFTGNTASGTWTASDAEPLTDELIDDMLLGNLYLNIHTGANPGGEIRGQVYVSEGAGLRAYLTNEQQPSEVTSDGSGTAELTLTDAGLVYQVTVDGLTGDITNAHFHRAPAGVGGGVVHGIFDRFTGNTASGVWRTSGDGPLTDELVRDLLTGNLYLNIHTAANGGGEIRGQVHLAGGIGAAVQLDPGQVPGSVTSDGTGTSALTLTDAGLVYDLTVTGLTGDVTNAHFHRAPLGVSGGVEHGIFDRFTGNTASGVWPTSGDAPLTAELTNELLAGNLYLNIHTAANGPGEIRGQVRAGGVVATAIEVVESEIPDAFALEQNYPNPFNPVTTITFALDQDARAALNVYNVLGQRVATLVDRSLAAGTYRITFEAESLPTGVYFYHLDAGGQQQTRKMLLLK